MRFYGYTADEVLNEPVRRFSVLLKKAMELDAREMLDDINVVSVPHIESKGARTSFINKIKQIAYPIYGTISVETDRKQLKQWLNGAMRSSRVRADVAK